MDRRSCVAALVFAGFLVLGALCVQDAGALSTQRVASGLNRPIQVTAPAGDSRLFIVEQRGVIKILKFGAVLSTPFLDIDSKIPNTAGNDERGLLGLAFHPDYANNGYFFVNYINLSNDTVVERYKVSDANPDVADPSSDKLIITVDQPFSNHNGGDLQFGPNDGYLYIGLGDGGASDDPGDRGQCLNTLLGKMLRIDIDVPMDATPYEIPPDNPWVDGDPGTRDEIWARGLRNPWRYSFDSLTGDLYIGDVGQDDLEEIDFQPADSPGGENYGWRIMEGTDCFGNSNCDDPPLTCNDPNLTLPIHEYPHAVGFSVTGGFVYRGSVIPDIQGVYFFADFGTAKIWSFRYDGENLTEFTDRTAELAPGGGLSISSISSFGEDGFGELYIVDRDGTTNGEVFKILPDASDVEDSAVLLPLRLGAAFPNPFSQSAQFRLSVDRPGELDLKILDASGRTVRSLVSGTMEPGSLMYQWDGRDNRGRRVPSGVYFVNASLDGTRLSRTLHLLR
jgi:glucose/arabinose dehydrogenase